MNKWKLFTIQYFAKPKNLSHTHTHTNTSKPDKGNNDGFMIQGPDDNGEYFDNIKAWFVSYRNYSSLSIK